MSNFKQALARAIPRIAIRFQNELVSVAPVDTGRLRNSIRVTTTSKGLLVSMVEYAKFIEFGSPPHVIKPRSKKALKFKGKDGKAVIVRQVNHPGSRPNPFIRNTIRNKLKTIIKEEIAKQLK